MRDDLLPGQCAVCKCVIGATGNTPEHLKRWLCRRCVEFRTMGADPRTVVALQYPDCRDMPARVMLNETVCGVRYALECMARDFFAGYSLVPAYCPTGMDVARWGTFLGSLGMTWRPWLTAPGPLVNDYRRRVLDVWADLEHEPGSYLFTKEFMA